jgi:hypothetical protein
VALFSAFVLSAPRARAAGVGADDSLAHVDIHAFVSQGFILTSHNDYIDKDKLRIGAPLFAEDLGPAGSFTLKADWFYVDYRWEDWLGFRVGRLKIPYGVSDIDSVRVPIPLPESIDPLQIRGGTFEALRLDSTVTRHSLPTPISPP